MDVDLGAPFGRYVDEEGWEWIVETDGNGGLRPPERTRYVGPDPFDCSTERTLMAIHERQMAARRAAIDDPREALLNLIAERPRTIKQLSRKIGWRHQSTGELVTELERECLVEFTYTTKSERLYTRTHCSE